MMIGENQRGLLDDVLSKGIQRNEEQRKIWANYRQGHEKIAETLLTFRKDLSVSCMVPIGRGALMKGKLIHTNEVLACLGDGYFAKYSAEGAAALCERRIKHAEEMLKNLSSERDLYETRIMALENDLFGDCAGSEIVEHWNEDKIEEWKVKHREREKEYHQKLAKLKQEKQEKPKIESEEDLFHRLDQLELEEELADEFNRLEGEHYELFGEELEEYSYESGNSSESEEDDSEEEKPQNKEEEKEKQQGEDEGKEKQRDKKDEEEKQLKNKNEKETQLKEEGKDTPLKNEEKETPLKNEEKKTQFKEEIKMETVEVKKCVSFAKLDYVNKQNVEQSTEKEEVAEKEVSEEDILRIEFSHSENVPATRSEGDSIETPADIYRIYSKPKSILKRSPNDIPPIRDPPPDYSTEEEEDVYEHVDKPSAYESVVKDIKERDTSLTVENVPNTVKETRPVSKFKRDRQLKR